jgi:hypothetical protein
MMRNPNAPHVNFKPLTGLIASNPKALPCNIDGVLERHGNFLILEWKHKGEKPKKGQIITLQQFARLQQFTVVIVVGDSQACGVDKFYKVLENGQCDLIGSSFEEFVRFYRCWYFKADLRPYKQI